MKKLDRDKQITEMLEISKKPETERPGPFSADVKNVIDENYELFHSVKADLVAYGVSYYEGDFCVIVYTKIGKGRGLEAQIPDKLGKYNVYYEESEGFVPG